MKSTLKRKEKESCSCSCRWGCIFKVSSMEVSNSFSSYSPSSVDSTKPSHSEASVNLSLSLTFHSTSPNRSFFTSFTLFFLCSVIFLCFFCCSHFGVWVILCRETRQDWPPVKARFRDTLKSRRLLRRGDDASLFVKVYMEGAPIGRKLDLCAFSGYESLLENLSHMFDTSIICK